MFVGPADGRGRDVLTASSKGTERIPEMAMHQDRRFNRIRPSGSLSRTGKIIVDPKSPVIDCSIVDYSAGGACIEVAPRTSLPKRFELLYSGTKKKCRVVWANGARLGISF